MNILLACSAGMSTSLLVQKMEKTCKDRGANDKIQAVSVTEAKNTEFLKDWDVLLVGPQVRFEERALKLIADPLNIPVGVIDTVAYGTMDAKKVLDQAYQLVKGNQE